MSTVTIKFRAKLGEFMGEDFTVAPGYKVPRITHSHVSFENRDTRVQFFLQGLNDQRVTESRLRKGGVRSVAFANDPRWTIKPIGNGFMADVSTEVEV